MISSAFSVVWAKDNFVYFVFIFNFGAAIKQKEETTFKAILWKFIFWKIDTEPEEDGNKINNHSEYDICLSRALPMIIKYKNMK